MLTQYLIDLFEVANHTKASVIFISPTLISSTNAKQNVFVMQTDGIPQLPFEALCTRDRISEFNARISQWDDVNLEFKTSDIKEVTEVVFSSKKFKSKMNFKCMKKSVIMGAERSFQDVSLNVARETPPKNIKVQPEFKIELSPTEITSLSEGDRLLKSEFVTISCNNGIVELSLVSNNGEKMTIDVDIPCMAISSNNATFSYRYSTPDFLSLIKHYGNSGITICSHGVIKLPAKHVHIYIVPIKNLV